MNIRTVIFSLTALCTTLSVTCRAQPLQKKPITKKQEIMITKKNLASDEIQIRWLIDDFVEAFHTRNLDLMMSLYAPGFVAFDIVPPLQNVGKDTYAKIWEKVFAFFPEPIEFETRDLNITAGSDIAFSRQLLRLQTTMANGQKVDRWERLTFCFQKFDDKWLIVHEHVSVPADLFTGKTALDLKPE
jgi:ketosteroid isomerase-like protein